MDELRLRAVMLRLVATALASGSVAACSKNQNEPRSVQPEPAGVRSSVGSSASPEAPEGAIAQHGGQPRNADPKQTEPAAGGEVEDFEALSCGPRGMPALLGGLKPALPVTSLALENVIESGGKTHSAQTLETMGDACGNAKDAVACKRQLSALAPARGFAHVCRQVCSFSYLKGTRAGEIFVIDSVPALKTFLGPIDSAQEAVLLAWAQGYEFGCDKPSEGGTRKLGSKYEVIATKITQDCPVERHRYRLTIEADGTLQVTKDELVPSKQAACIGRRPRGLVASRVEMGSELGAHFARAAELEAASVAAFRELFQWLERRAAPKTLLEAAERAARDEVRHARMTARLARRFGVSPRAPEVRAGAEPSLEQWAIDNATEGCVRETFGALVAEFQAQAAGDAEVADTMRSLAADEARHAALAWDIAHWLEPQLSDAERRAVQAARRAAIEELERAYVDEPASPLLTERAGLPEPAVAKVLLSGLKRELWDRAADLS